MATALEVIQPSPTWDVLDSTKLTEYMSCPRKFFYSYILGWKPDYANNHLVFGSAWHIAMEWLLNHPGDQYGAVTAALEYYREHLPPETDDLYEPKTPINLATSLQDYLLHYKKEYKEQEVLYTELAGLVLVSEDRTMVFKCDAILRNLATGQVFGRDFKTSQRKFSNWGDHFVLSTQMLLYLHALHCLFPETDELKMIVRSAFFYKKSPTDFADHPIDKTLDQMEAFLTRINMWIDRLDHDTYTLTQETTDDTTMQAFPQNDTACFNFGRQCAFFDFCNAWSNPLARCDSVPIGFKVEHWNPLDRPEIRQKINLATQSGQSVEMDK